MALPAIFYNSKTITLPRKQAELTLDVGPTRVTTRTLAGVVDTLVDPRMAIRVIVRWTNLEGRPLLVSLENFRQWALQGEVWSLALDSSKIVDTTLSGQEAAGQTTLSLNSISGVLDGEAYKLIGGPYFSHVVISGTPGGGTCDITSALDFTFANGSIFRDLYYFPGVLLNDNSRISIIRRRGQLLQSQTPTDRFDLELDFYETVT